MTAIVTVALIVAAFRVLITTLTGTIHHLGVIIPRFPIQHLAAVMAAAPAVVPLRPAAVAVVAAVEATTTMLRTF